MYVPCILYGLLCRPTNAKHIYVVQGGSNMTGTDFCVNNPHMSRSYLNHLVYTYNIVDISQALLHVSIHLHHLQGVLSFYFAKVTKKKKN